MDYIFTYNTYKPYPVRLAPITTSDRQFLSTVYNDLGSYLLDASGWTTFPTRYASYHDGGTSSLERINPTVTPVVLVSISVTDLS